MRKLIIAVITLFLSVNIYSQDYFGQCDTLAMEEAIKNTTDAYTLENGSIDWDQYTIDLFENAELQAVLDYMAEHEDELLGRN